MNHPLESIFGKGSLSRIPQIPGAGPQEGAVIYVSFETGERPEHVFSSVIERIKPPLVQSGGVILDGCIITTPLMQKFYPLAISGDLELWKRQISLGAEELGYLTAEIKGERFLVSNGTEFHLSQCLIEFDSII